MVKNFPPTFGKTALLSMAIWVTPVALAQTPISHRCCSPPETNRPRHETSRPDDFLTVC